MGYKYPPSAYQPKVFFFVIPKTRIPETKALNKNVYLKAKAQAGREINRILEYILMIF